MNFVFTNNENLIVLKRPFAFIGLLLFPQIILANETNPQCYSYLTELVRSSHFLFKEIPKEDNNLLTDTDDRDTCIGSS